MVVSTRRKGYNDKTKRTRDDDDDDDDDDDEVAKMESKLAEYKLTLRSAKVKISEKNGEITKLKEENAHLKNKLTKVISDLSDSRKKEGNSRRNKGFAEVVTKKTKRELWRVLKFMANEKQEREATEKVLDVMKIREFMLTNDEAKDVVILQKRSDFVNTYAVDCREGMNEQRSYVQSQMKKVSWKVLEKDETLPSVEDIYKVATRNIPPPSEIDAGQQAEHDRLMKIFVWYWDVLLAACAGNTYWREAIRRYQCISIANHEGKVCITCSTEALCAVMYDNCQEKWIKMFNKKAQDAAAKIPKKKDDPETEEYAAKYSDPQSGQAKYGGWCDEGLKQYQDTIALVKASRETELSAQLEQECLALVRAKHNMIYKENGPGSKKKGKKRRRSPASAIVVDFDEV